jgi:hypothetical protein
LQKTQNLFGDLKDFCTFHYLGNEKFLVSTCSKKARSSSLWIVERNTRRKVFSDIGKTNTQSVSFGCDQGNGSLIVAALRDQSVVVKDIKNGFERK